LEDNIKSKNMIVRMCTITFSPGWEPMDGSLKHINELLEKMWEIFLGVKQPSVYKD
jgi:hypothetical protein